MLSLDVQASWAAAVLLLSIRIGALLVLSPVLASLVAPTQVRVLLVLGLSALMLSAAAAPQQIGVILTVGGFVVAAAVEVFNGALLAFAVFAMFGAVAMAARLLDFQMGFGVGMVLDPVTRAQTPVLGTLFNLVVVALFFAMAGHHALLRGIAFSVEQVPLGTAIAFSDPAVLVRHLGLTLSLAMTLIAPVFVCLLIVDLAIAATSRVLPQMNVLVLGMPVKIAVGLGMMSALAFTLATPMERLMRAVFGFWEQVLR